MSFLAPLFLAGAAALALPFLFHLVRRTTRQRTPFSSLRFLTPSPPRLTQRSRLEDLLLLALRCLALILVAVAFARPFLSSSTLPPPPDQPPERWIVLVDDSASMQRANLRDLAAQRTAEILRRARPSDETAVWTFQQSTRPVLSFTDAPGISTAERAALASSSLQALPPAWGPTHLDQAVITAIDALLENDPATPPGPRRIFVVSDFAEGSRTAQLQAFDWPNTVSLTLETVAPSSPGNASLHVLPDAPASLALTQSVVRVRLANSADANQAEFQVAWGRPGPDSPLTPPQTVVLPPGQSRILSLPVPSQADADRILLLGDAEPFDNIAFVIPPSSQPRTLDYLGPDHPADTRSPLFFLRRALPASGPLGIQIQPRSPNQPLAPDAAPPALHVVTESLPIERASELRQSLIHGATALLAPRDPSALAALAPVFDLPTLPATEAAPRRFSLLGTLDFQHPLLAPFADPRFSDFSRIQFWRHRVLPLDAFPNAHVIARFDDASPAWLDIPVGQGRALLFASGWHPDDSQLALSTKFVPLLAAILDWAGAPAAPVSYLVGESLTLSPPLASPARLQTPDGSFLDLAQGTTRSPPLSTPGLYALLIPGTDPHRFAVNLDPAESRTTPMPRETLEALGVPLQTTAVAPDLARPQRAAELAATETESRQKLWRWLLLTALAVLILETFLAGLKSRRLLQPTEALP